MWTPLHCAAEKNHVKCVDALLRAGAQVDSRVPGNWSALHMVRHRNTHPPRRAPVKTEAVDFPDPCRHRIYTQVMSRRRRRSLHPHCSLSPNLPPSTGSRGVQPASGGEPAPRGRGQGVKNLRELEVPRPGEATGADAGVAGRTRCESHAAECIASVGARRGSWDDARAEPCDRPRGSGSRRGEGGGK